MATDGLSVGQVKRAPRHIDLDEAISCELSHAVSRLRSLKNEIAGTGEPLSAEKEPTPTPTLAAVDVYANASGQIREFCNQINVLTGEIQEMIL